MDFSYFPGCAAHSSAIDQHLSTTAVCNALDISLTELVDWNCCGATPGHTIGGDLSFELCARNLRIATSMGRPMVVPCASCFSNLKKTAMLINTKQHQPTDDCPDSAVEVISIATFLSIPSVLERIEKKRRISLEGLTIAPYYGCLLTRPESTTGAEDSENPHQIDQVAAVCGAKIVSWPYKTDCCGGPHTLAHPKLVEKMSTLLLNMAEGWHADLIVTACPMCHASLDTTEWNTLRRKENRPLIPVLYLTELVALALEIEKPARWLKRHLVDPRPLLREKGALQ